MHYWIGALLLLLSGFNQATELVVYTWEYYLAPEIKNRFEQETGIHIKEVNYDSDEARNRLLSGGYPPEFDIVSIDSLSLKIRFGKIYIFQCQRRSRNKIQR